MAITREGKVVPFFVLLSTVHKTETEGVIVATLYVIAYALKYGLAGGT